MNICALYYDGFCEFELVFTAGLFKDNLITVSLKDKVYISEEGQRFLADKQLSEISIDEVDLFFIPGGNPEYLFANQQLKNFMLKLNENKKYISGICGGTYLMANYGLLKNKKCTGDSVCLPETEEVKELFSNSQIVNENVVIEDNIITATGTAYLDLAIEIGKLMGVNNEDNRAGSYYKWLELLKNTT